MARNPLAALVATTLPEITEEELADLSVADRRAETFMLYSTGWTQSRIAKYFGVSQSTVFNDLQIETRNRRARALNVESEIERIAGVYEAVMTKAWSRHEESAEANINSVASTNYLKLVLEAAGQYASLRGLDSGAGAPTTKDGKTRVIVQIGGSAGRPDIAVGVES